MTRTKNTTSNSKAPRSRKEHFFVLPMLADKHKAMRSSTCYTADRIVDLHHLQQLWGSSSGSRRLYAFGDNF